MFTGITVININKSNKGYWFSNIDFREYSTNQKAHSVLFYINVRNSKTGRNIWSSADNIIVERQILSQLTASPDTTAATSRLMRRHCNKTIWRAVNITWRWAWPDVGLTTWNRKQEFIYSFMKDNIAGCSRFMSSIHTSLWYIHEQAL